MDLIVPPEGAIPFANCYCNEESIFVSHSFRFFSAKFEVLVLQTATNNFDCSYTDFKVITKDPKEKKTDIHCIGVASIP